MSSAKLKSKGDELIQLLVCLSIFLGNRITPYFLQNKKKLLSNYLLITRKSFVFAVSFVNCSFTSRLGFKLSTRHLNSDFIEYLFDFRS